MFIQGWSNQFDVHYQFGVHYLMFWPKPVPSCVFLYDFKHIPSKNTEISIAAKLLTLESILSQRHGPVDSTKTI